MRKISPVLSRALLNNTETYVEQPETINAKQEPNHLLKLTLDMGPLAVFFATYAYVGGGAGQGPAHDMTRIGYATGALMIATLVSLVASRLLLKRIPVMPLVTGIFVLIFGGLTLYLQDPTFIKIKATILYLLFATALAAGLFFRKLLLKMLLSEVLQMRDEGWRILTLRWIGFFIFLAIANEIVWRNFSEPTWVGFKSFGVMPLTFLFMTAQVSLIMKYQMPDVSSTQSEASSN
jgi:intracellular septation protein